MKKTGVVASALLLFAPASLALQSGSASFEHQTEAATLGGGSSSSISFDGSQQAIGEVAGSLSSVSYESNVGVVQPVTEPDSNVDDWQQLRD